jgi:hypothetical protein
MVWVKLDRHDNMVVAHWVQVVNEDPYFSYDQIKQISD